MKKAKKAKKGKKKIKKDKKTKDVPTDQDKWRNVDGKLKYLSEKPGKGD